MGAVRWLASRSLAVKVTFRTPDDEIVEVDVATPDEPDAGYRITVGTRVFDLPTAASLRRAAFLRQAGEITVQVDGREYRLYDGRRRRRAPANTPGDLHAPMAGRIIRVLANLDDDVRVGDTLVILETMKMEQQITAPRDGIVTALLCKEGDQVAAGQELVALREAGKT